LLCNAVLTEQEHQWPKQKDNSERLTPISRSLKAESAKQAREVGRKDEEATCEAIANAWVDDDDDDDGSVCSVLERIKSQF
jgi:hypothetical protein